MRFRPSLAAVIPILLFAACAKAPDLAPMETEVSDRVPRVAATLANGTFGLAVRVAVLDSPELGRGTAALREAEAGLLAAGGTFQPQLSLGVRPNGNAQFSSEGYGSLSQVMYDGGAGFARQTAARARVLGGIAGRTDAGSQAALAAVRAWADVATARALLRASGASLGHLDATMAKIEERAAAGAGGSGEVLIARSRMANERAAAINAEAEVARAEAVFQEVFGFAPATLLSLPPKPPIPEGVGADGSPIVLRAEAAVLAAEADNAAAKAGRVPSLSLTLSALAGTSVTAGLSSQQLLSPARGRQAEVEASSARIDARRVEYDATLRAVESRLKVFGAEMTAVDRRLKAALEATAANRENLDASRDQYGVGRQTLISLLDAEREALASERLRIIAEHDKAVLDYAFLAATGDILDAFGIVLPDMAIEEANK